jgi:hypothetical protein
MYLYSTNAFLFYSITISWENVVTEYIKRYDAVFCATSAKAHLDVCDIVVDGAKDKWRYPIS